MLSYKPLWDMLRNNFSEGIYPEEDIRDVMRNRGITKSIYRKLQDNEAMSMESIITLCDVLDCGIDDILAIIPDEKPVHPETLPNHPNDGKRHFSYAPLWETLSSRKLKPSVLTADKIISYATLQNLKNNAPVQIRSLQAIVDFLGCDVKDIVSYDY